MISININCNVSACGISYPRMIRVLELIITLIVDHAGILYRLEISIIIPIIIINKNKLETNFMIMIMLIFILISTYNIRIKIQNN